MEDDTFELEAPVAEPGYLDDDGDEGFEDDEAYVEEDVDVPATPHVRSVPEAVRRFVVLFHKYFTQKNVDKITGIYHYTFSKLTDRFFKDSTWPSEETIAPLVNNDTVFLLMYKELYFRHIYSKREQPSLSTRFESWHNYRQLFDYVLASSDDAELGLPLQWLWDMVDEFLFQFQSYSQNRCKLANKSAQDLALFKEHPDVWSVTSVITYLEALAAKGKVVELLAAQTAADGKTAQAQQYTLVEALGYFALVGLSRIHCLLGDYHSALRVLEPIDLTRRGLYTRVTACHVSLYYYLAFAYLMTRRYGLAVQVVGSILTYMTRTKQYHTRSYQYDQMMKKNEQLYYLLALAGALAPQGTGPLGNDLVEQALHEKCGDKLIRINRGELAAYEDMFNKACPKFIHPSPPHPDALLADSADSSEEAPAVPHDYHQEPRRLQARVFMQEVEEQAVLGTLRSFLRLYTTISLPKLAGFLDTDAATVRAQLMCYKHKTAHAPHLGPRLPDSATPLDVTFHIQGDMVHVVDAKQARRYTDYFLRHIHKFDSIHARLAVGQQH